METRVDGKTMAEEQHKTSSYIIPDSTQPPSAFKPVEFKVQTGQIQPVSTVPAKSHGAPQIPTQQHQRPTQQPQVQAPVWVPPPQQPAPVPAEKPKPARQIPVQHQTPIKPVGSQPRASGPKHSTPRYASPSPQRHMIRYPSEPSLASSYSQYSEASYSSRNVSQSPHRYEPVNLEIQMNGTSENVPQLKRPSQYTNVTCHRRGKLCNQYDGV